MLNEIALAKQKKFTESWWNNFIENTNNFSKHYVVKEAFDNLEVNHLTSLVEKIIKRVTTNKKRQGNLRIWKDGKFDKEIANFFEDNPIRPNEDIQVWKNRVLGDKKFGLFLNYAETHSEELSKILANYIKPYTEKWGIPLDGMSTTIILGDYGWTPLGIHRDNLGEYIVHFHLGPGNKDIYIWDKDKSIKHGFRHKVKTANFEEFMNDYSYKTTFNVGDIFSMTGKNAHIGNTNEFSIGLVLEFNRPTEKEFIEKMWFNLGTELFDKNFTGDKARIIPPYDKDNHKTYMNFLMKGIKYNNIDTNKSIKDALENNFYDFRYRLSSNGGFSLPPIVDRKKLKKKFIQLTLSSSIKLIDPFKIFFHQSNEHTFLFIRGEKVKIKNSPNVLSFIKNVNEGKDLKVSEIKNNFFNDWEDSAIFKLLFLLYKHKGVKIKF